MRKDVFLAFIVWSIGVVSFGQVENHSIEWLDPIDVRSESIGDAALAIRGGQYLNYGDRIPVWTHRIAINQAASSAEVVLSNVQITSLSSTELELIKGQEIDSEFRIISKPTQFKGRPFLKVIIVPVRRNPSTGRLEKLLSFSYSYELTTKPPKRTSQIYADHSVLSTGTWMKMAIVRDGLYKIDQSTLNSFGFDASQIDPRNIQVYGNPGGMLPENTSVARYDDLRQNAIEVIGESDGSFDNSDYVLFYAQGPHRWELKDGHYVHVQNIYSDTAYYFMTVGSSAGIRVSTYTPPDGPVDVQINEFIDRAFSEIEETNLVGTGRLWFGEYFDITTAYNYTFNMPSLKNGEDAWMKVETVARAGTQTRFTANYPNGTEIANWYHTSVGSGSGSNYVNPSGVEVNFLPSSNNEIIIRLNYDKLGNPSAVAWLDYVIVNGIRNLNLSDNQMAFRNPEGVDTASSIISEYTLSNAQGSTIWDISDPTRPQRINPDNSGSTSVFKAFHNDFKEYIAFKGNSFYSVASYSSLQNQDLHGMVSPNVFVITSKSLQNAAEDLTVIHEQHGWTSEVVLVDDIYNEFSSGAQDLTAIRDFLRMHYLRPNPPGEELRHVVLYGDASYDYKDRIAGNTNHIPTWETEKSFSLYTSYAMDDYLFMLDDGEGSPDSIPADDVDLSFGRIVANTASEANAINEKIETYYSAFASGDWINDIVFVADDVDKPGETVFVGNAEELAIRIDTTYPRFNIDKIYLDAYVQEATPAGQRYPSVKLALRDRVEKGVLLVNYIGHGGELGWAHERVLENSDILSWTNIDRLTNFLTVTCEFTRYDDPKRISAGEHCLLNPVGAVVSLFSTSRVVYASPAHSVNSRFYDWAFEKVNGEYLSNGEVMMYTKNSLEGYTRQVFGYFGDPCTTMPHPEEEVKTTEFKNVAVDIIPDTISALSIVQVKGEIVDDAGNKNFNGEIVPTVYDKRVTQFTRANNGVGPNIPFELQKNIIYKGRASVTNGEWEFEFVVPKDIAYQIDYGRISYYAINTDKSRVAGGYYDNFLVGGTDANPIEDEEGPQIRLYMNDEEFVFGGITDESPDFLAVLEDQSGINTIGNGIGHDLIAVLDGNSNEAFVLNDYYTSDMDSYQSGRVVYPFFDLEPGRHTIDFKAFDTYNNSSEASLEFVVAESADIALKHVLNYPNPFTTYTEFHFEHNRPGELLDVQVQIFTVSGKIVKTINTTVQTEGFRVDGIAWDGRDDFGDRIGKGTYIYKVEVRSSLDSKKTEVFEKLVILQ